jgi:purine-binding chemotaxis protein CheW
MRAGTAVYGCDVLCAQEIIPLRRMTRLPGAPEYVRGLINVRGTIVTVIDLGARVEPGRAVTSDGVILLVRTASGTTGGGGGGGAGGATRLIGLVVEEVMDVEELVVEPVDRADAPGIVSGVGHAEATAGGGSAAVVVLDLDSLIKQVLHS